MKMKNLCMQPFGNFLKKQGNTISGRFLQLKPVAQKSGKTVFAWAIEKDIDAAKYYF